MSDRKPPMFSDEDLPDWLRNPSAASAGDSDSASPNWLSSSDVPSADVNDPAATGDYSDLFAPDSLDPTDPTAQFTDPFTDPTTPTDPDLANLPPPPDIPDADLPEWLRSTVDAPADFGAPLDNGLETGRESAIGYSSTFAQDQRPVKRSKTDILSDLDWLSNLSEENSAPRPAPPPTSEMPNIAGLLDPDALPEDNPFIQQAVEATRAKRRERDKKPEVVPLDLDLPDVSGSFDNPGDRALTIVSTDTDESIPAEVSGFTFEDTLPGSEEPESPRFSMPVLGDSNALASLNEDDRLLDRASELSLDELSLDEFTAVDPAPAAVNTRATADITDNGLMPGVIPPELERALSDNATTDLPTWLSDLRPTGAPVALTVGDQTVSVQEQPIAQMSDQLRQLRDRARQFTTEETDTSPTAGILAGITGAIPAAESLTENEPTILQPIIRDYSGRAAIMRAILEDRPEVAALKRPQVRRIAPDRVGIFVMLLLLLIAPFFTGALNVSDVPEVDDWPEALQSGMAGIRATVTRIGQDTYPILVLDYQPGTTSELDPLVQIILADLLDRGARPILIPTTAGIAAHIPALIAALPDADRIIAARWLAGGELGIRNLADLIYRDATPIGLLESPFTNANGLTLELDQRLRTELQTRPIFLFHDTGDGVRRWAEQFRGNIERPARVVLLTTSGAAADAHAYSGDSGRTNLAPPTRIVEGTVSGLQAVLYYRQLSGQNRLEAQSQLDSERWQSIGVGTLAAALIIVIGLLVNAVGALNTNVAARRRRARRKSNLSIGDDPV